VRDRRRDVATGHGAAVELVLTCTAGFEGVVDRALAEDEPELERRGHESGVVRAAARSARAARPLVGAGYLSGVHQVVVEQPVRARSRDAVVDGLAAAVGGTPDGPVLRPRSFRLRIMEANQPVAVAPDPRRALERAVQRWVGAPVDARGGGGEVWVSLRRGDPVARLLLRLDDPGRRRTPAGALRPEVAGALVRVVPLVDDEVFLDPFAGSGAVAAARARYPHGRLVVTDAAAERARELRRRAARGDLGPRPEVHRWRVDGAMPSFAGAGTVDTIVTDPPWGVFGGTDDETVAALYEAMAASFAGLLAPAGRLVVLVADPDRLDGPLAGRGLAVASSFGVLVNGRKASVVTCGRTHPA
jgi:16S rRNA G966 N2-methylase RsmD